MSSIITFIIEVVIASGILTGFYYLVLKNLTFFRINRYYLLLSLLLPFVLPLLNISMPQEAFQSINHFEVVLDDYIVATQNIDVIGRSESRMPVLTIVFIIVSALLLSNLIVGVGQVCQLFSKARRCSYCDIDFYVGKKKVNPFSVFRRIYVNETYLENKTTLKQVLTHEQAHINQYHGVDVFVSELICVFAWFNPFFWILKKELKSTHEYLADEKVLEQDIDLVGYFLLIFNTTVGKNVGIANHFNQSINLKRMKMMKKKRSSRFAKTIYLMALPVFVLVVLLFSEGATTANVINDVTETIILQENSSNTRPVESQDTVIMFNGTNAVNVSKSEDKVSQKDDKEVFMVVEKMPKYPGGDKALMEYLNTYVVYPKEAIEKGIQGRVYVQFVVAKDGKISNVEILKGVDKLLDAEALRVIKEMPKWEPGIQKGKAVNVSYRLPINFTLK